jgi:hypothetical protein
MEKTRSLSFSRKLDFPADVMCWRAIDVAPHCTEPALPILTTSKIDANGIMQFLPLDSSAAD